MNYEGSCHCGAVKFRFRSEPIERGIRCNCSICRRRGALMSSRYYAPDEIEIQGMDALRTYHFGDLLVNHRFCGTCGIHPFGDNEVKKGHIRVNLGCVDGLDTFAMPFDVIDGKSF